MNVRKMIAIVGALMTGGVGITLVGLIPHALARSCDAVPCMLTTN
jgi:uncharacterized membrane protein YuzA (DUF378 family)